MGKVNSLPDDNESGRVRADKWLWAARFFKTRSLAADSLEKGKVHINGSKVKPAYPVRIGDHMVIDNGSVEWEVEVCGLSDKRGTASMAQALYQEHAESLERKRLAAEQRRLAPEPAAMIKGRPTKRNRRLLDHSFSE